MRSTVTGKRMLHERAFLKAVVNARRAQPGGEYLPSADDRKNEGCKIARDVFDEVLRTKERSMNRLTIGGGKPTRQFGYSPEVCHGSETNILALFRVVPSVLTCPVSQFW
jgi:hypothetical protein